MRVRGDGRLQTSPGEMLEIAHRIVGGVAHQAARQGHAGALRLRLRSPCKRRAQRAQHLAPRPGPRRALIAHAKAPRIELNFQARAETDKRISRQALAALDALQQEARPKRRELQVRRDGLIQIRGNVERRFHHRAPHLKQKKTHHRLWERGWVLWYID